MTSIYPANTGPLPNFKELQHELAVSQQAAAALPALKQQVDAIGKSLDEFAKDGPALADAYAVLDEDLKKKIKCVHDRLGPKAPAVDAAAKAVDAGIDQQQADVKTAEESLTADTELTAREAKRGLARAQKALAQLQVSALKARIAAAQALVKEADGYSGPTPGDAAAADATLHLAHEALHWTLLDSDFVVDRVGFQFPRTAAEYETAAIAAYAAMAAAAYAADTAAKDAADAKAAFDAAVKALTTSRTDRKKDRVAAARKAAEAPAKAPDQHQAKPPAAR